MTPRSSDLPPETLGIRHIALKVKDMATAERFYVEILGFIVEWRPDSDNLYLAKDRDSLALHKADFTEGGSLDHFGIMLRKADDVDAWAAYLENRGLKLEKEPRTHRDGARSFYMRDPEGNLIQFIHHPLIH